MSEKIESLDPREARKRRREYLLIFAAAVLFALTTYSEIRLSNLSNRLPFVNSIFFFGLINFNIMLLMVLVFLVFRNISKLFLERRRKLLGSRLKSKLVLAFLSFTVIPTSILFLISSLYINSSFDKWFSIKVQNTLQAALEITQTYYKNSSRVAQHLAKQTANNFREKHGIAALRSPRLKKLVEKSRELSAVDGVEVYIDPLEDRVAASSDQDLERSLPRLPMDVLEKAFAGETVSLVQHIGYADFIRAVAPVTDPETGKVAGAVAVSFVIPMSLVNRVDEISSVFKDYKDVNPLKYPIKTTYFIILVMMTLLIVFVSIWIGLYLARELTIPLERLVKATQRITQGNLDFEIINPGNDEIANLTGSFNEMTSELKRHRAEIESTNRLLSEKSAYVEAILNNVSAGVLSVSNDGIIMTANFSVGSLLEFNAESVVGKPLSALPRDLKETIQTLLDQLGKRAREGDFTPIQKPLHPLRDGSSGDEQNERRDLILTATPFNGGLVIVIDDISYVSKVQREAAWREVARRVAHEIKNPLTPIKLSAQRIQKKFGSQNNTEAVLLRECTDTIIKNVDELRDMVNEFSAFARFPQVNPTPNNLNEAVRESVVLFEEAHRSIAFVFEPETRMPSVEMDRDQIKRVLINLIDNAVAALAAGGVGSKRPGVKQIHIRTHYNEQLNIAAIEVEDNGPGMTETVSTRLFEPYFSTKANGTGLGLAIAKRIVSDHNGFIRVHSAPEEGTKFTVELPVNLIANPSERMRDQTTWPEKSLS